MGLVVYNTLSRTKQPFVPLDPPKVGMYVCGLTVYDHVHIGHARTAVAFEIIRRWLRYRGYEVLMVQNVTDVDDRIIDRANELGRDPVEHAAQWDRTCRISLQALGLPPADVSPHVSSHMAQIIRLVTSLVASGAAYVSEDGSVYYSVASKPDYGKLSNRSPDEMLAGARVKPAQGKRQPQDFALWKAAKAGEPTWDSPWGPGRPGWHIECSAMCMTYLGEQADIHGGGVDLVFPHHENEVAQSESATGKPFVKYWLHAGFLTVNGEKMSKSMHNFITVDELLRTEEAEVVRFFYAHTHYRSAIDYTPESLDDSRRGLERLRRLRDALSTAGAADRGPADGVLEQAVEAMTRDFGSAMDDDFNTREAIAALFAFAQAANKAITTGVGGDVADRALTALVETAGVLTVLDATDVAPAAAESAALVDLLLHVRERAREMKVFDISDEIRDRLTAHGYEISDAKDGSTWRRVR